MTDGDDRPSDGSASPDPKMMDQAHYNPIPLDFSSDEEGEEEEQVDSGEEHEQPDPLSDGDDFLLLPLEDGCKKARPVADSPHLATTDPGSTNEPSSPRQFVNQIVNQLVERVFDLAEKETLTDIPPWSMVNWHRAHQPQHQLQGIHQPQLQLQGFHHKIAGRRQTGQQLDGEASSNLDVIGQSTPTVKDPGPKSKPLPMEFEQGSVISDEEEFHSDEDDFLLPPFYVPKKVEKISEQTKEPCSTSDESSCAKGDKAEALTHSPKQQKEPDANPPAPIDQDSTEQATEAVESQTADVTEPFEKDPKEPVQCDGESEQIMKFVALNEKESQAEKSSVKSDKDNFQLSQQSDSQSDKTKSPLDRLSSARDQLASGLKTGSSEESCDAKSLALEPVSYERTEEVNPEKKVKAKTARKSTSNRLQSMTIKTEKFYGHEQEYAPTVIKKPTPPAQNAELQSDGNRPSEKKFKTTARKSTSNRLQVERNLALSKPGPLSKKHKEAKSQVGDKSQHDTSVHKLGPLSKKHKQGSSVRTEPPEAKLSQNIKPPPLAQRDRQDSKHEDKLRVDEPQKSERLPKTQKVKRPDPQDKRPHPQDKRPNPHHGSDEDLASLFTDDGREQTYYLPNGWKKLRRLRCTGNGRQRDTYLVPPMAVKGFQGSRGSKMMRSNVDILRFVERYPNVPLDPDYVNMETPLDHSGRTQGNHPATLRLKESLSAAKGGSLLIPQRKTGSKSAPVEMEVQDVLGSLQPVPFQQVEQSVDFVNFGPTKKKKKKAAKKQATVQNDDLVVIDVVGQSPYQEEDVVDLSLPNEEGINASSFVETVMSESPAKAPRPQGRGRPQQQNKKPGTVVRYNLPDGWHKTVVSRKAGREGEVIQVYLVPPGFPSGLHSQAPKLGTIDELISFVQSNFGVPINPNYVNFEKPLNSTGRTHLTDHVIRLRKLLQAHHEKDRPSTGSIANMPPPSLKRKQQQTSFEAKRVKGQPSVLKRKKAAPVPAVDDDIEVVYRSGPGPASTRRPINPDILETSSGKTSSLKTSSGPLKVARKDQNFVIEYNHDEQEEPSKTLDLEVFSAGEDSTGEFTFYPEQEEILIDENFVEVE